MRDSFKLILGLLVVVSVIAGGAYYFESFLTKETIVIKIDDVEKITTSENESYYLIHTKNETFENRFRKFHSKETPEILNQKIIAGRSYRVEVVGFALGDKVPFLPEYRNITKVIEEVRDKRIKQKRL